MRSKLAEDDEDFQYEFNKVFDNPDAKEAYEEFTPDFYDNYVNMELTFDWGWDRPEFARVKKRLKDANEIPIGVANEKPILDSIIYEVEYFDGYVASMAANVINENLLEQFNQEGNMFLLIKSILDTRTDGTQTLQKYLFVITKSGTKRRKIQLKDGNYASNGSMEVLHRKNLKTSGICIQYKWQSTRLRIEFQRSQNSHGWLKTCWIKKTE